MTLTQVPLTLLYGAQEAMFYTFLKLHFLFDGSRSRFWSKNHEEFRSFLKLFHI